jgi:hypothetical protein
MSTRSDWQWFPIFLAPEITGMPGNTVYPGEHFCLPLIIFAILVETTLWLSFAYHIPLSKNLESLNLPALIINITLPPAHLSIVPPPIRALGNSRCDTSAAAHQV